MLNILNEFSLIWFQFLFPRILWAVRCIHDDMVTKPETNGNTLSNIRKCLMSKDKNRIKTASSLIKIISFPGFQMHYDSTATFLIPIFVQRVTIFISIIT